MTQHVQKVHSNKKFACDAPGCNYSFDTLSVLKIHQTKYHKPEKSGPSSGPSENLLLESSDESELDMVTEDSDSRDPDYK